MLVNKNQGTIHRHVATKWQCVAIPTTSATRLGYVLVGYSACGKDIYERNKAVLQQEKLNAADIGGHLPRR